VTTSPTRPRRPPMDARIRDRRRAVARATARRRRRVTLSVLGLVALAAVAVAVARSPLLAITDVEVTGVTGEAADEVRAAAAVVDGENLLAADLAGAADRVRALPWVRDVAVRRVPPATVNVRVIPRQAAAVVRVGEAVWLVDAGGVVIGGGTRRDLVVIDAPNAVLPPAGVETTDAAVRGALAVHAALPEALRERVERYEAPRPRALRFQLSSPPVAVRFGAAERVDAKAAVILALLDQLDAPAVELPPIAELDVRAPDNPVLLPAGDADDEPSADA
jgi:cell division protein FtsQ